jgi:hypothetical protein
MLCLLLLIALSFPQRQRQNERQRRRNLAARRGRELASHAGAILPFELEAPTEASLVLLDPHVDVRRGGSGELV